MIELTGPQLRFLKGRGQLLEPVLKVGHAGLSDAFLASLDRALDDHELVKVKFTDFKEEKKTLTPVMAEKTRSRVILRVGNVAVLYRPAADPEKRRLKLP